MLSGMEDRGIEAGGVAVNNSSGTPTSSDAARSRRRFRVRALLVVLLVVAGGYATLSRTQEAVWVLPASFHADPTSTSLTIFVVEQGCTSGQAPSITEPEVELGASTVTIAVRTRERFALSGSCPSNPPTPVEVELGEPLGDRVLVDAYGDLAEGTAPTGEVISPWRSPLAAQR